MFPEDVWILIERHGAAMTIQRRWRRYTRFSHTRRREWSELRAWLCTEGLWDRLVPYAHVRREWRSEPASWIGTSHARLILDEAEAGLWGWALRPFSHA
jgi:hypothetical protein